MILWIILFLVYLSFWIRLNKMKNYLQKWIEKSREYIFLNQLGKTPVSMHAQIFTFEWKSKKKKYFSWPLRMIHFQSSQFYDERHHKKCVTGGCFKTNWKGKISTKKKSFFQICGWGCFYRTHALMHGSNCLDKKKMRQSKVSNDLAADRKEIFVRHFWQKTFNKRTMMQSRSVAHLHNTTHRCKKVSPSDTKSTYLSDDWKVISGSEWTRPFTQIWIVDANGKRRLRC